MRQENPNPNSTEKKDIFEKGLKLGSTSIHKLEALRDACKKLGINTEVTGSTAESEINSQPYGFNETYRGALNRAEHTREENPQSVAIGIENGIVPIEDKFVDLAIVVILTPDNRSFIATSGGVEFPKEAVEEARLRGFETTTAGDVISETRGGSKTDPHSTLTEGRVTRKGLMIEVLVTALSQLLSSDKD